MVRDKFKEWICTFVEHSNVDWQLVVFLNCVRLTCSLRPRDPRLEYLRPVLQVQELVSLVSWHLRDKYVWVINNHVLEMRWVCGVIPKFFLFRVYLVFKLFFQPGIFKYLSLLEKWVIVVILTALRVWQLLVVSESARNFNVGWVNDAFAVVYS